jgi:hypothetical protein
MRTRYFEDSVPGNYSDYKTQLMQQVTIPESALVTGNKTQAKLSDYCQCDREVPTSAVHTRPRTFQKDELQREEFCECDKEVGAGSLQSGLRVEAAVSGEHERDVEGHTGARSRVIPSSIPSLARFKGPFIQEVGKGDTSLQTRERPGARVNAEIEALESQVNEIQLMRSQVEAIHEQKLNELYRAKGIEPKREEEVKYVNSVFRRAT